MTRFSILDVTHAKASAGGNKNKPKLPKFESAEHEYIGDHVTLRFDAQTMPGTQFAYKVGTNTLTFGRIVALAGDFYGNYTYKPGDVEQLSDNWDTKPESSIALGVALAKTLSGDTEGYLAAVLKTMKQEENEVRTRMAKGEDVAQIFASFGDTYDKQYNYDTSPSLVPVGAYALIALCNWDHFGQDAYKAYSAVHTAALRKAKEAYDGEKAKVHATMVEAYFLEGYAQHFLTDLFSSGHLRTPRKVLHQNMIGDNPDKRLPQPYPADRCAQKMHNEDCANGLWVRNRRGDAWATYGDKQLWSSKANQNFLQALKAAQAGVDEVWKTRETGSIPAAEDFSALKLTPILDNLDFSNYCPLFKLQEGSVTQVLYRDAIDNRSDFTFALMAASPGFWQWNDMLDKVAKSDEDQNMYPFTEGFLSQTAFVHLREAPDSAPSFASLLDNRYGPLESGDYGSAWTMVGQFNPKYTAAQYPMEWLHAASVSHNVRSVVGRTKVPEGWHYYHLGIEKEQALWSEYTNVEGADYVLRDVVYGNFHSDQASGKIGMVRYFEKADESGGRLDSWVLDGSFTKAPRKAGAEWTTVPRLSVTLSHQMTPDDSFKTFVGFGENSKWCFCTWTNEYQRLALSLVDFSVDGGVQALLSVDWNKVQHLLVISLGASHVGTDIGFTIEILTPRRVSPGQIELDRFARRVEPVTWGVFSPDKYLTWFFADSRLITVAIKADSNLVVVAFSPFTAEAPVVSQIGLKPGQGSLLTAPFMTPIRTMQATYTYPQQGEDYILETTNAAIMMFFDNFGVLGARLLAPVTMGSASYEIKGQTPAISGQPSKALGIRRALGSPQAIGIIPRDVKIL